MKRPVALLLALLMLCSCTFAFTSCKKKGEPGVPTPSKKTVEIDLSQYVLVRASGMPYMLQNEVLDFTRLAVKVTGKTLRSTEDKETDYVETEDYEILVGDVKRVETQKAMKDIEGYGYVICVINNKIVIVGSNNLLTQMAFKYFRENYFGENVKKGEPIKIHERVLCTDVPMLTLIDGDTVNCTVVYEDGIDDAKGSAYGTSNVAMITHQNPDELDYPVIVRNQIRESLASLTGLRSIRIPMKTDASAEDGGCEIQIGNVSREAAQTYLHTLDANEYGISVKNGKIVLGAWNDVTLVSAYDTFNTVLKECATETDGVKKILVPADYEYKKALDQWQYDFPKPELTLTSTTDVFDDSIEYYYEGEQATDAAFENYCVTLEANGYTTVVVNEIEGSKFRTYKNVEKGLTLHVTFDAFRHREEYSLGYKSCIRVVAASLESVNLPDATMLNPNQTYVKVTDPMVTAVRMDSGTGNVGMGYILTMEDGSFVLYDGGGNGQTGMDHQRLFNILKDLYHLAHGTDPNVANPIIIRAWVITHDHWDHASVFNDFVRTYGRDNTIRIERFLANFASDSEIVNGYDPSRQVAHARFDFANVTGGACTYIKVHTGQKFYFANMELEVICTHESLFPNRIDFFNDTSTVIRYTIYTTDGAGNRNEDPTTAIFLGDLFRFGSRYLCGSFGNYLKSDIVQLAHHGAQGCEKPLYETIAPEYLLWPNSSGVFDRLTDSSNKGGSWVSQVNYMVSRQLECVKYIIVSDSYNTTLTIGWNGIDPDSIYDAAERKGIAWMPNQTEFGNNLIIK